MVHIILLGLFAVAADPGFVTMDGSAPGTDLEARAEAVRNAQTELIVSFLEDLTDSQDLALFGTIIGNAPGYIESNRLVRQGTEDGSTSVEIEAKLRTRALRQDAAAAVLPRLRRPPKVVVLVGEEMPPQSQLTISPAGEASLVEQLKKAGLDVLDPAVLHARHAETDLTARLGFDTGMGSDLARKNLVDVAVLARAVNKLERGGANSNLLRNQVELSVRVYHAQEADDIDELSAEAVVSSLRPQDGGRQAVEDACVKVAPDVVATCVLSVLGKRGSSDVILCLDAIQNHDQVVELLHFVGEQTGVSEVEELYCQNGEARLRIAYRGPIATLTENLSQARFADFRLDPRMIVDRAMRFRISARKKPE